MIYENDRDDFASMMVVTWQSFGRNKPDGKTMRFWFDKLITYDLQTVGNAFDQWIISQKELPTVNEIIKLCKPVTPIYSALERKVDAMANKQHMKELMGFIEENSKPRTDYKAWARRIIGNFEKGLQVNDYALKCARDALNEKAIRSQPVQP